MYRFFVGFSLLFIYTIALTSSAAAQANDLCENATPLAVGSVSGSSAGATGAETTPCSLNDTLDVWYNVAIPGGAGFKVSVAPDDFDAAIALYDACGGNVLDCDDTGAASQTNVVEGVNNGAGETTYWVRVAGSNGGTGSFTLSLELLQPPANDLCANAIPLTGPATDGTSVNATGTSVSACSLNDTKDVWYSALVAAGTELSVAVTPGDFDVAVALYDACGGAELDCDDSGSSSAVNTVSTSNTGATDVTVLVRIAGANGGTGHFSVATTTIDLPDNDDCANALQLNLGLNTGTSLNATGTSVSECSLNDTRDV